MFRFTQTIASSFGIAAISRCGPSGAVAGVRGRRGGGGRRRRGLWRENRSDALTESEVTERDISKWKDWFWQCRFTTCFSGIGRDACFLCLVRPVLPKEVDQEHNSLHKKSLGSVVFYVYFHFLLVFWKNIISYSAFLVSSFFLSGYSEHILFFSHVSFGPVAMVAMVAMWPLGTSVGMPTATMRLAPCAGRRSFLKGHWQRSHHGTPASNVKISPRKNGVISWSRLINAHHISNFLWWFHGRYLR